MKHDSLVKNTTLLFINKFSSALAVFLLLPLYTKYFSVESYGTIDLIVGYIALIAPVLSLKLDMGIFKHLVDARDNKEKTEEAINSLLGLLIPVGTIFITAALVLGMLVDIPFYSLVILAVIANVLFGIMSQITRGLDQTKDFVVVSVIVTVISFLISVLGIMVLQIDVEIILISLIVSQLIGAILMMFKTRIHTLVQRKASSKHVQKQLLKFSVPLVIDSTSFWVMNTSSRTIIAVVIGPAANGIYAVASKFTAIIEQVIGVFFQAFIETATLYAKKPNKSELYSDVMNKYLRLFWSGCVLLIVAMPFIFPVLVRGEEFASAALYVPVMIVAAMVRAAQNFISAIYQANGHTKQVASTTVIGATVNLVVCLCLVPFIGIWSAVVASLATYSTLTVYRYFDVRKYNIVLKLQFKILVVFAALVIVVLALYYLNNFWLNLLNIAIASAIVIAFNRGVIREMIKYCSTKISHS